MAAAASSMARGEGEKGTCFPLIAWFDDSDTVAALMGLNQLCQVRMNDKCRKIVPHPGSLNPDAFTGGICFTGNKSLDKMHLSFRAQAKQTRQSPILRAWALVQQSCAYSVIEGRTNRGGKLDARQLETGRSEADAALAGCDGIG
ncbi:hypothetical protein GV829_01430 [Sphingomonas lacunae]|uniref:Uncharacterized protein n=1 Tax=Sphingomonas lacunae TaxID=2698828 RepID=A0A6M4AQG0_9SPHN|nr:hypothetical protein [Sphingomonas lacunae]QJQ31265.1 hypothetical protein GV829_01430 [Sphingomonas lacunae]